MKLYVLLGISLLTGCAANEGATTSTEADQTSASGARVSGDKAERLLATFDAIGLADHAMGGRASVEASSVSCITRNHSALEPTDPDFMIPTTTCAFDIANYEPAHQEISDPPARGTAMFDAIARLDENLADSAMGSALLDVDSVSCVGDGPGNGNDPKNPPETTATCTVKANGRVLTATALDALRLVQALGFVDAVDHAMGGRFSADATGISCRSRNNNALDDADPQVGIAHTECTLKVNGRSVTLADPTPKAVAIAAALEHAGVEGDAGMGKVEYATAQLDCLKGPGQPTTCTLAPPR